MLIANSIQGPALRSEENTWDNFPIAEPFCAAHLSGYSYGQFA